VCECVLSAAVADSLRRGVVMYALYVAVVVVVRRCSDKTEHAHDGGLSGGRWPIARRRAQWPAGSATGRATPTTVLPAADAAA